MRRDPAPKPEVYVAMPMPHRTQQQLIKRRLVGKDGSERIRELRAILTELPGYRNGPYADLRKWVEGELEAARTRKKAVHRDSIAVRREGAAQIALVGPPNAGKSSLLQALSAIQIRTGDYPFTTTRPVAATTRLGGVLVQLVEIPGLIEGATHDRGGGRSLLGVLRNADAILWCHACDRPVDELEAIRHEVAAAGIDLPGILAATKCDEAPPVSHPELPAVPVSVLDDASLDRLREELWALTGLVRIYLRDGGDPIALRPPATVLDVAGSIHHELVERCTGAHIWGPSARFEGQRVGRQHELQDEDTVEVLDR
jgi:small GTP-binding protein